MTPSRIPAPFRAGTPEIIDLWADAGRASTCTLVILVDGLGAEALAEYRGHVPFLRSLEHHTRHVSTVLPSTTATALVTFFTGASPLVHGVLGYSTMTADGTVFSHLKGAPGVSGDSWNRAPATNLLTTDGAFRAHVGPERYGGSFFTHMMQPDEHWRFYGYRDATRRVSAVKTAVRHAQGSGLVYLHVPDLDKAGHNEGPGSRAWLESLEDVDGLVRACVRACPPGWRVVVTADHGMVPGGRNLARDLALAHDLIASPTVVAGEGRALMLRYGHNADPHEARCTALREWVGESGTVLDREQMLNSGVLGAPGLDLEPDVASRLGDYLVIATDRALFTHSRHVSDASLDQQGVHGGATETELTIPWIDVRT